MSRLAELLQIARPDWNVLPEELESAWTWMESQGYGRQGPSGYLLTAYAGSRQLGPVFSADLTLEGWVDEGDPRAADLLPIAEISGSGGIAALWRDPLGTIRVVALDSDGGTGVLADSVSDFLVLLAIGYDDITTSSLGAVPSEREAVDAVAPFRTHLTALGLTIPEEWPSPSPEPFTTWLETPPEAADATTPEYPFAGIAVDVLALLGSKDGPELAARFGELTGVQVPSGLEADQAALRENGIFVFLRYGILHTVTFSLEIHQPYPHPERLIDGLAADTGKAELRARLGKPVKQSTASLRYEWGDRSLSADFQREEIARITLSSPMPAPPAVDDESVFTGAAIELLRLLGEPDSPALATQFGAILGVDLGESVKKASRKLRGLGVEVKFGKAGLETVWTKAETFPGTLVDGIDTSTTHAAARALLGSPEAERERFLTYCVFGGFINIGFDDGVFRRATLMHERV